jgi:hypothetical protein
MSETQGTAAGLNPNLVRGLVDSSIGIKTVPKKRKKAKNEYDGGEIRVEEHDAEEWKTIRQGVCHVLDGGTMAASRS